VEASKPNATQLSYSPRFRTDKALLPPHQAPLATPTVDRAPIYAFGTCPCRGEGGAASHHLQLPLTLTWSAHRRRGDLPGIHDISISDEQEPLPRLDDEPCLEMMSDPRSAVGVTNGAMHDDLGKAEVARVLAALIRSHHD